MCAFCCRLSRWARDSTIVTKSAAQFGTIATFTSDLPLVIVEIAAREYLPIDDFQSGVYTSHFFVDTSLTAVRCHMSWSPLVPSSTRALQLQKGGAGQAPSSAAFTSFCQVSVTQLLLCPAHNCLFFTCHCSQCYLDSPTRYSLQVLDDCSSVFRHRAVPVSSALAVRCPRYCSLLLPRCRAGGWHIVHEAGHLATCSSMFLRESSHSHLVVLFSCSCLSPL